MTHKLFSFFAGTLILCCACAGSKVKKNAEVIEVRSTGYDMPDDFYRVYYAGNYRILESHYIFDSSRALFDTLGHIAKKEFIQRTIRTRFLVFHKDSTHGYRFDRFRAAGPERISVDSAFKLVRVQFNSTLDSLGYTIPDSVSWSTKKTERKDIYITRATANVPTVWRALSYSTEMRHIAESFSKNLDSARQMKLFSVEIRYDSTFDSNGKLVYYPTYLDHRIQKVLIPDSVDINSYIQKYKQVITKE